MKIRSGFRSSIKSEISERERERERENRKERRTKRKAKNKGKVGERGNNEKKKKKIKQTIAGNFDLFRFSTSMIPFVRETENSVFAPRYVGRALIDEAWSDRRSERGGPSCVVHALFSAKLRGTGEGRGRGERGGGKKGDPSRDDFRWKVEIVCGGRRWPGRERKKKNIGRSRFRGKNGENVPSGFYRTFTTFILLYSFRGFFDFPFFLWKVYLSSKDKFFIGIRM